MFKPKSEIASMFKLTAAQLDSEMNRKLSENKYETHNWYGEAVERQTYHLQDYDESFVYVYNTKDGLDMKLPYTLQEDTIQFDFELASRIKYTPTDWEDGKREEFGVTVDTYAKAINKEVAEQFESFKANFSKQKDEEQNSKIEEYQNVAFMATSQLEESKTEVARLEKEIAELKEFKAAKIKEEKEKKVDSLLEDNSKFFSLEEREGWKEKSDEFDSYESFEKEFKSVAFTKLRELIGTTPGKNERTYTFIEKFDDNQNHEEDSNDVFTKLKNKMNHKGEM